MRLWTIWKQPINVRILLILRDNNTWRQSMFSLAFLRNTRWRTELMNRLIHIFYHFCISTVVCPIIVLRVLLKAFPWRAIHLYGSRWQTTIRIFLIVRTLLEKLDHRRRFWCPSVSKVYGVNFSVATTKHTWIFWIKQSPASPKETQKPWH